MASISPFPVAVWSGEIMGVKVHVLDNGMSVIDADDLERFFERLGDPDFDVAAFTERFGRWSKGGEP